MVDLAEVFGVLRLDEWIARSTSRSPRRFSPTILRHLQDAFSESTLPFKVDVTCRSHLGVNPGG